MSPKRAVDLGGSFVSQANKAIECGSVLIPSTNQYSRLFTTVIALNARPYNYLAILLAHMQTLAISLGRPDHCPHPLIDGTAIDY